MEQPEQLPSPRSLAGAERPHHRRNADSAEMLVHTTYVGRRAADWLEDDGGIPAVELPLSNGRAPGTEDLFGLLHVTLNRLLQAANGGKTG